MHARSAALAWTLALSAAVGLAAEAKREAAEAKRDAPPEKKVADKAPENPADKTSAKKADDAPAAPATRTAEELAKQARKAVVVVTFLGRDGQTAGLGSGFIIRPDGLIATNLHVVSEARPIRVKLHDGAVHDVKTVVANDRRLDLALLKIDAKDLPTLPLGDSDKLEPGQPVVAMGNPRGLEHSVVAGVVSARREVEGRSLIQIAMPIEPGNSGGPLLDMQGRVQGIVNMKSLATPNLGFAVEVNSLKPLIDKPNPVSMDRWLTIGALDRREWQPLLGARWWQRAGRLHVESWGSGFGGRSVCLSGQTPPELPYELGVAVKLDDEAGAAGLIFHTDGEDKHYGFYPTGGKLRLTRFEGPDVFTWKVLAEVKNPHYRAGEWNWLKVRVEKDKLKCYVNDELAIESTDQGFTSGGVGLAKFRATRAEFKQFRLAKELPAMKTPALVAEAITKLAGEVKPDGVLGQLIIDQAAASGPAAVQALRERARALEQQAAQLEALALEAHRQRVRTELVKLLAQDEDQIDLLHAGLLLAWYDNDELDVAAYRRQFDRLADDLKKSLAKDADDAAKQAALHKLLFEELGFHGSRGDYYSKSNSYLNEVLDDREGLPITLSVVYIELARRIGLKAVGVGLPGHFVVEVRPKDKAGVLVDVFDGGKTLSRDDAAKLVREVADAELTDDHLHAAKKPAIILRMLHNLLGFPRREQNAEGMLPYLDAIIAVEPKAAGERWVRAVVRYQTGRKEAAIADVDWVLENQPEGLDLDQARELRKLLEAKE